MKYNDRTTNLMLQSVQIIESRHLLCGAFSTPTNRGYYEIPTSHLSSIELSSF